MARVQRKIAPQNYSIELNNVVLHNFPCKPWAIPIFRWRKKQYIYFRAATGYASVSRFICTILEQALSLCHCRGWNITVNMTILSLAHHYEDYSAEYAPFARVPCSCIPWSPFLCNIPHLCEVSNPKHYFFLHFSVSLNITHLTVRWSRRTVILLYISVTWSHSAAKTIAKLLKMDSWLFGENFLGSNTSGLFPPVFLWWDWVCGVKVVLR